MGTNRHDVDMTPLAPYGRIFVRRRSTALDCDRTYFLILNGIPIRALGTDGEVLVVVKPGNAYTLHMELGALRSDPITVRMEPNEELNLTCYGIDGGKIKRALLNVVGAGWRIKFEQDTKEHGND